MRYHWSHLFFCDLCDLQLVDKWRQRACSLIIPLAFTGHVHKGLIVTKGQARGKGTRDSSYTVCQDCLLLKWSHTRTCTHTVQSETRRHIKHPCSITWSELTIQASHSAGNSFACENSPLFWAVGSLCSGARQMVDHLWLLQRPSIYPLTHPYTETQSKT